MATTKKFAVTGVSTFNGKTKIRWANDVMRIKILAKNGHQDLDLVTLPHEMTKAEIVQYLYSINYGSGNPAVTAALKYAAKKNPAAATAAPTAASTAPVAALHS